MFNSLGTFLDHLQTNDRADNTVASYNLDLLDFIHWFEGTHGRSPEVTQVTPLDIREYRTHLLNTRQMKPASINRHLAALRSYFKWAYGLSMIKVNPVSGIRTIRQPRPAPQWLNRQDTYALLRATTEAIQLAEAKKLTPTANLARRDKAIIVLMLFTGLRVSEVCHLRLNDVEVKARSGLVMVRYGKGHKYREVPLNKDVRQALSGWLAVRPSDSQEVVKRKVDYLFYSKKGGPLRSRAVQRMVERLAHAARIEVTVTPHTLRHTFGKNLVDTGISLDRVALLMGHENLDTTAMYTTPSRADLAAAVEGIAWTD